MEIIAFITLVTGTKHQITQEEYSQINEASSDDWIQIGTNTAFKKAAVMEIQDISEWVEEKSFNYGQPYTVLPAGIGFRGMITRENRIKAIELMANGLKKSKAKFGRPTPTLDSLLQLARERYNFLKQNKEPLNKYNI